MSLTVRVIVENSSTLNKSLIGKAGLCLYIQDEKDSILFDTGPDNSLLHNANILDIDLNNLNAIVISHGHYDHCGGIPYLPDNSRIICHPKMNVERYAVINAMGYNIKIKKLSRSIDYSKHLMIYSKEPLFISQRFIWSGEIPVTRKHSYGVAIDKHEHMDLVVDEGVLIYKSECGLIIFIGCGHRGIIDIVNHCKKITGINHIHAIFGGLHLRYASPKTAWTVRQFLKQENPDKVFPCHCTGKWGKLWIPNATIPTTGQTFTLG